VARRCRVALFRQRPSQLPDARFGGWGRGRKGEKIRSEKVKLERRGLMGNSIIYSIFPVPSFPFLRLLFIFVSYIFYFKIYKFFFLLFPPPPHLSSPHPSSPFFGPRKKKKKKCPFHLYIFFPIPLSSYFLVFEGNRRSTSSSSLTF